MKILAFAASNSSQSINKQLVSYAAGLAEGALENTSVEIVDLNDYEMPIYSSDRETETGIPQLAHDFRNLISTSDAVIISYAEHNGSYTAAYKNLFDWVSRIDMKVYQGKPVVLLATSPGPGGAQNVLASAVGSAPHFGMDVKGSLSVPRFYDNFNAEAGELHQTESAALLDAELKGIISRLG